jgi:hypothetical protein
MNDNNGIITPVAPAKIIRLIRNGELYSADTIGGPYDTRAGHAHRRSIVQVAIEQGEAVDMLTAAQLGGRVVAMDRPDLDVWAVDISPPMAWELEREVDDTYDAFLAGTGRL